VTPPPAANPELPSGAEAEFVLLPIGLPTALLPAVLPPAPVPAVVLPLALEPVLVLVHAVPSTITLATKK
jgi:hypothetical protein